MDQDYVEKLDDSAKEWLSKFNVEYYGNTFAKGPGGGRPGVHGGGKNLHKKADHKLVYNQTNARNRDMYNQRYRLYDEPEWGGMDYYGTLSPENALIEAMDRKRRIREFVEDAIELESNEEFLDQLTRFVFNIGE